VAVRLGRGLQFGGNYFGKPSSFHKRFC
jgi:hypothetical protein